MTSLTGNFERYITVDNADIVYCVYCSSYSSDLKTDRRGQVVCQNFEDCVYNRLESGTISEARAQQLLGHPL